MSRLLPAGTRVGRVVLAVSDLDAHTDFFERVVGLTIHDRSNGRALLATGTGGSESLLELHASDAPDRGDDETGLFHVAFRVPDRAALGAALERIEARWLLDGVSDHLVSEALYLRDPEGNGIEIYRDRKREAWPRDDDGTLEIASYRLDLDALRSASTGAATVPDGTDVGHVHLEVSSIAAARAVYVDALGFSVRDTWARNGTVEALFVAAGDYHHHVGLNTWNDRTKPSTGRGLKWVELLVPDADTLDAVERRLANADTDHARQGETVRMRDADDIAFRLRTQQRKS